MFTIDEFTQTYNNFISAHEIGCNGTPYCRKQENCSKCPLYYMSGINTILYMLNNTPDYPHSNRLFLETKNEVQKIAYYDENMNSWEINYTCTE